MKRAVSVFISLLLLLTCSTAAFAVDFVPSIEAKTAPEPVEIELEGESYGAVLEDQDGKAEGVKLYDETKEVTGKETILELYVISAAEKENAILPEIKESLTAAEEEVAQAESFNDLNDGLEEQIAEQIQVISETSGRTVKIENLVVSDLFDVSLIRDRMETENIPAGESCTLLLKTDLPKEDFVALLNRDAEGSWYVVTDVEWTEDGYLKVTVQSLFIFAFIVEKKPDLPVDPHGPYSPQTGEVRKIRMAYMATAAVFIGIAGVFFVKAGKHRHA